MKITTTSRIKNMSPQLLVSNLERAIDFYTRQLGFEVDFRYEDFYASVIKDGFSIHLKSEEPSGSIRKGKAVNEHLDVLFSVEGIEQLYEELSGKSVNITQPLRQMPYGREFYVADLDGNLMGFMEPM